jgi:hypothetical protein
MGSILPILLLLLLIATPSICIPEPVREGYKHYLGFCTVFKNEAPFLREWIEFHRAVGGTKFYLYSNNSTDTYQTVLAPYIKKGLVKLFDWPTVTGKGGGVLTQCAAYAHCAEHFRETRWLAYIDVDEFMYPGDPAINSLYQVLPKYEEAGGLVVRSLLYGSSGHVSRPAGPVVENYLWRAPLTNPTFTEGEDDVQFHVKSVVDGAKAKGCGKFGAHIMFLRETEDKSVLGNSLVNERLEIHNRTGKDATKGMGYIEHIRTNHYKVKSKADWEEKKGKGVSQGQGAAAKFAKAGNQWDAVDRNEVYDDAILRFMPKVRRALQLSEFMYAQG